MILAWLFLTLASLLRCLTLYGFDGKGSAFVILIPFVILPFLPRIKAQSRTLFEGRVPQIAGLLSLLGSTLLLRFAGLDYWETQAFWPNAFAFLSVTGSLWVAVSRNDRGEGSLDWIWTGLWMMTALLDPVMPMLGASALACALAFRRQEGSDITQKGQKPFLPFLILGLVLPKAWWDFDMNATWALSNSLFILGALGGSAILDRFFRLSYGYVLGALSLFFFLYFTPLAWLWGLGVGLAFGIAYNRLERPISLIQSSFALLLGVTLSFALHANALLFGRALWLFK